MFHENLSGACRFAMKKLTKENNNFRKVIFTGKYSQLVVMSIAPGEEIGEEVHPHTDQILFFVMGEGQAIIEGQASDFEKRDAIFIPAGTKHNFVNTGNEDLKLYTVYSPPEHKDGTIHKTKADAEMDEEDHY